MANLTQKVEIFNFTLNKGFSVTKIRPKIQITHESLMKASKLIKHLQKNLRLEYNPEAAEGPKNL